MDVALPVLVFAAFMALFWVLARREELTVNEWMRCRPGFLVVCPVVGAVFAVSVVAVGWFGRRR